MILFFLSTFYGWNTAWLCGYLAFQTSNQISEPLVLWTAYVNISEQITQDFSFGLTEISELHRSFQGLDRNANLVWFENDTFIS